ncbi:MAG: sarcosine oxidase subunit gamma [Streptosporangiales bacterium]|nr:sarcosine oxidase subunit gamma [Streptosporangiales bacterium]MBO0889586.1 sarcosine oxidase subunit gamma [Acidothermales bacterium]
MRRSPLAELAGELAAVGGPGSVRFAERPFRVQVELRAAADAPVSRLYEALALMLPRGVGYVASTGDRDALCLAPRWWLVTQSPEPAPVLESALAGRLRTAGGAAVSAVDVSAQRTTIDVTGPNARDVLAHGCSVDLHPRAFGPGRCTQTALAKAQVVLQQLDRAPTFRVLVRASFARYLAEWLLDAATEYVG